MKYGMKTTPADPAKLKQMQVLGTEVNHIGQEITFRAACDGYDNSEIYAEYRGMIAGTGFYEMHDFFPQSDYMPVYDEEEEMFVCRFEYDLKHAAFYGIVCAAVQFPDGKVIRGYDHAGCYDEAFRLGVLAGNSKEGFIDGSGEFVDRRDALVIALKAGQLKEELEEGTVVLMSFMLNYPDLRKRNAE